MQDLIIIGVGFPDIIQTIEDINKHKKQYNVLGFLDDNIDLHGSTVLDFPVLGSMGWLKDKVNLSIINTVARDLNIREKVNEKLGLYNVQFAKLIHPSVNVQYAYVEENVLISKNVYIEPRSKIMAGTMILPHVTIGHDVVISKNCFIGSGCHLGGFSTIGENCLIGAGSSIHPNISISRDCKIGVNSSIFSNLKPKSVVFNRPVQSLS